jgi:formylglycine-generating enzyme required for sulfatase activity
MMGPAPKGNVNMTYGSSCPVNEFPPSASGFYDVHGNVWEWVRGCKGFSLEGEGGGGLPMVALLLFPRFIH